MHIIFKIIFGLLVITGFATFGLTNLVGNQLGDVYYERISDDFAETTTVSLEEGNAYYFRVTIDAGAARTDDIDVTWTMELQLNGETIRSYTDSKDITVRNGDDDRRYNDGQFVAPATDTYELIITVDFAESINSGVILELNEDFAYFNLGSLAITNQILNYAAIAIAIIGVIPFQVDRYLEKKRNQERSPSEQATEQEAVL